jgi:hypothetical protein
MKPGDIVIFRTPMYTRTGPDSFDHYVEEKLGIVVSMDSDDTVNIQELKPTHIGYMIDPYGKQNRSARVLKEFDFPTWGRRVDT